MKIIVDGTESNCLMTAVSLEGAGSLKKLAMSICVRIARQMLSSDAKLVFSGRAAAADARHVHADYTALYS
jgi:hypothetical protein